VSVSTSASRLLARALRRSAPGMTRAVVSTLLDPERRRAVAEAVARFEQGMAPVVSRSASRHPLAPAAVRIERSRVRKRNSDAEQVAVTMWFGEGPALPSAGGRLGRGAVRVGAGVLSAAAVAAATTLASRLAERPAAARLGAGAARARLAEGSADGGRLAEEAPTPRLPAPGDQPAH
jgi:hypothetical protein